MAGESAIASLDFTVITITYSPESGDISLNSDVDAAMTNWILDLTKAVLFEEMG